MINFALIGFVFLGLFSPGPNVILVTASGARFGFKRTIPHILGIVVGVGIIAGTTGLGVGALLQSAPVLTLGLKVIAFLWILWMAYKLWKTEPSKQDGSDTPFTFVQAVLFQWINPKIWAVALAASSFVVDLPVAQQSLSLGLTFSTLNLGVCTFWTVAGSLLSVLLTNPKAWRVFMRGMAIALAVFSALVFY